MRSLSRAAAFVCLPALAAAQTNFPPPPAPVGNPVTTDKVLLGMALFFEEQMSSTDTVACATCHDLARGGIDARATNGVHPGTDGTFGTADDRHASPGVARHSASALVGVASFGFGAQVTPRRAPTVINSAYQPSLFYDGRAANEPFRDPVTNQILISVGATVENLVLGPPVNPIEMGHVGRTWNDVAQKVAAAQPLYWASQLPQRLQNFVQGRTYPDLFQQAFGSAGVTPARIVMALASYLRTLNSDQSPWDRHLAGTYPLSYQEQVGLSLFTSPRFGATACNACHGDFEHRVRTEGPIVGQMTVVTTGYYGSPTPTRLLFHNIGVRPMGEDPGRSGVTGLTADQGRFRIANLRNVELSAPYFHNGSAASLLDAIDFYDRGGDFHANQAPGFLPRQYNVSERAALVAILCTLTDPRLVAGQAPFDRPVLGSQNGRLVRSLGPGMSTNSGRPVVAHAPIAPRRGASDFSLTLSGVSPGTFTLLMWDTATQPPDPAQYNFALALGPNFQCFAIGFAQPLPGAPGVGVARLPLPLPSDPAFQGVVLYAQWLALEPSGQAGLVTSNALRLELQ
jgi:cytochrome c peroxidase